MSLYGGGGDHPPHKDSESESDYKESWSMFDVILILVLIAIPIIGVVFGL